MQHLGRLRVEALYLLDVLKVVPFLGLGASLTNNPDDSAPLPVRVGGHLVFGVDYLVSRSWIVVVFASPPASSIATRSMIVMDDRNPLLRSLDLISRS